MINISKYLCWVNRNALHLNFHHICPNWEFSTVVQHLHFLLKILQKQSSGYSANFTSTSFISGSPSASIFFRLWVSASDTVSSESENTLFRSLSDALLGVLVGGSDNWTWINKKDQRQMFIKESESYNFVRGESSNNSHFFIVQFIT